jgi:hypothetical protein
MNSDNRLDIAAATRLVEEISANLDGLPEHNSRHAQLRAEVADLKAMLARAGSESPELVGKIKSVRTSLDNAALELHADGIRAGAFLSEIGRILGLD